MGSSAQTRGALPHEWMSRRIDHAPRDLQARGVTGARRHGRAREAHAFQGRTDPAATPSPTHDAGALLDNDCAREANPTVIHVKPRGVRWSVIALSTPNHPFRLASTLAASIAFFAIIGAAGFAAWWIVDDQRSSPQTNQVLGASFKPDLPSGIIAVQRVNSTKEFADLGGFKPFIPMYVPGSTQTDFTLSLTLPDDDGHRIGRVGYSAKDVADADGITGPTVVLVEVPGTPGANTDPRLQRVTSGSGRALAATIGCQGLTIDVQLYFGPTPKDGEPFVTPHMVVVGQEFLDGINEQCAHAP